MQILIIAATEQEIKPFIAAHPHIDVLITGVGVPTVLYHLQKRLHQIQYDLIIQAGIAGAFDTEMQLGQTVFVKQDCFADLGLEENDNYTPIFETQFADKNEFPFSNGWMINTTEYFKNDALSSVKAITVNKVTDNDRQNQQFKKQFNADIESMEGAALHYVCLQEDIPFLQVRAISNYVGERDKTKWKLQQAVNNLCTELATLINRLTN